MCDMAKHAARIADLQRELAAIKPPKRMYSRRFPCAPTIWGLRYQMKVCQLQNLIFLHRVLGMNSGEIPRPRYDVWPSKTDQPPAHIERIARSAPNLENGLAGSDDGGQSKSKVATNE